MGAGRAGGRKGRPGAKPQHAGRTLKRILSYMGKYKIHFIFVLVFMLISTGASVAGTYFLKPIINDYIVPLIGRQAPDLSGLSGMLILLAVIYATGALSGFVYQRIVIIISTNTLDRVRRELFSKMQTLPIRYFDTHTHGELMSRYTNDVDTLRQFLSQSLVQFVSSTVSVVSVFVMMLVLSPALTGITVFMLLIMLFIINRLGRKSKAFFIKQQSALGAANGYIEEMIEGQKVVKVFSHEEVSKAEFSRLNDELFTSAKGANTFASMLMPIMGNLSYVQYALTAMVGGMMAVGGVAGMDIGTLASFLQYTRSFSMPITQVSQQFNFVLQALAGAERIFTMIDEPEENDEGTITLAHVQKAQDGTLVETDKRTGIWAWKDNSKSPVEYVELKGDVRFENVTFGYEEDKTVLKNLSLYAKPGQKIAFVGSTGAGKTTITNLINRFYDVQEGRILYDGIDVQQIKKHDLRRSLSMVLQDTHLFTGTVSDNIRYGNLKATDEKIRHAAKLANADSFIRHLPDGYDTMITGDGANLSQGQRQLLAIARAALADPPVLILDEATSSIDTRTELLIEKGMDQLMMGRTVFVIAHRLSTVRNAKAIIVLENGEIIERGNHEALVEEKGKYYQLYTGAFELS
ncbi:ABC transporter ATP-binding protein/permease [Eubacteriales bacterium OttesenSCG-928-K08]|nr:ABC transporter ATP-binding protein/permease [Eubacteriales bacterium OttesenSCG-928-K08]